MMKLRFAAPGHLIDLGRIGELKGIKQVARMRIGAMTTENELIWSTLLAEKVPLLVEGARLISDPQVRYKGTIGGDISHGDPGNDHPALMVALDATFVLKSAPGERVAPADGFFMGRYATDRARRDHDADPHPGPAAGTGWCYAKLKRKTGDFAAAAAAVLLRMKGGALGCRDRPDQRRRPRLRARAAEDSLRGKALNDAAIAEAARLAMTCASRLPHQRGDVEYKTAMAAK